MSPGVPPPAPHIRLLLDVLTRPASCAGLDAGGWDLLVRTARAARLLGALAARIDDAGVADKVPEPAARHLRAATAESTYLRQMSLRELASIAETLRPLSVTLVALKGSAYILTGAGCAAGRLPRDVDLMVERRRLDEVERALRAAGWSFAKTEEYDQRYYREWSHELPPMRAPTLPLELDMHHSILPPIGRLKPDAARLIADSVAVPGSPYRVLRPADQVLHAVVHLFQDSDCVNKLRDLLDIDGLLRQFAARDGEAFRRDLGESVAVHGLGRPLWYALAFCRAWLDTPIPEAIWQDIQAQRPPPPARALMTSLASRVLAPVHPDAEAGRPERAAASLLELRALWLRMPPRTVVYHAASKAWRSMRRPPEASSAG